jgi:hypothetical protein
MSLSTRITARYVVFNTNLLCVCYQRDIAWYYSVSLCVCLLGLNRLALCDSNKERIMRKSVLPLYVRLLDPLTANEEEHMVAAQGLWSLLFCDEARRAVRADPACKLGMVCQLCLGDF